MAKTVKITGLKEIQDKIKSKIKQIQTDKGVLDAIGAISTKEIKKKIREGISPSTGRKFKELAESTIKSRDSFDRNSKRKSPYFIPDFSNLTKTGQMVRNIDAKSKENKVIISVKNTSRHDSQKTNAEIADFHEEGDRPFMGIPKETKVKIVKALNIFLERKLK
jgi:hypothetical protein